MHPIHIFRYTYSVHTHSSINMYTHVYTYILERKANIEALSNRKLSALMLACVKGRVNIVRILIDNGADVKLTTVVDGVYSSVC